MTTVDSPPTRVSERPARRRPWWRSPVTVIGLVLLLAGFGVLGWVAYQYYGTNIVSQRSFDETREQVRQEWDVPPTGTDDEDPMERAVPGDAVALLRVPEWGDDYEVPILMGTTMDILANGVGMYESSVPPGEVGNFTLAGHRVTHGEPFARLLELKPGSEIIIETRTKIYTYVLDNSPADLTVDENAVWVLDPVPGEENAKPTRPLITLTTCQDLFHSPDRSVGFGHLESTVNK